MPTLNQAVEILSRNGVAKLCVIQQMGRQQREQGALKSSATNRKPADIGVNGVVRLLIASAVSGAVKEATNVSTAYGALEADGISGGQTLAARLTALMNARGTINGIFGQLCLDLDSPRAELLIRQHNGGVSQMTFAPPNAPHNATYGASVRRTVTIPAEVFYDCVSAVRAVDDAA